MTDEEEALRIRERTAAGQTAGPRGSLSLSLFSFPLLSLSLLPTNAIERRKTPGSPLPVRTIEKKRGKRKRNVETRTPAVPISKRFLCVRRVSAVRPPVVGGPSPSHDGDAAAVARSLFLGSRKSEITGIQVSADRVVPR